jgi:hypothetical protein
MPLQATSGAASYDGFGGGVAVEPVYIEQIFSTWLYTGTGSTQTITNGIDLAGKGGLVWTKSRSSANGHFLNDSARGINLAIQSNTNSAQGSIPTGITAFNSSGFDIGASASYNTSGTTYASWAFRKQPKFFDVVTYTGDGTAGRTVAHNLGSVPGCIIVKCTSYLGDWQVYHRSLGATKYLVLNQTGTGGTSNTRWNNTAPTSTEFTLGTDGNVNYAGRTFVAYVFAHNAGGFGLSGTDNVISCGSFTADGSGNADVNLGYEPQYIMWKRSGGAGNWETYDTMRGWSEGGGFARLFPNTSDAESTYLTGPPGAPTSTGFKFTNGFLFASNEYVYIAIRRGPMKVPTSGTSVFSPISTSAATGTAVSTGFPVDMQIGGKNAVAGAEKNWVTDRLRGVSTTATESGALLQTTQTDAENTISTPTRFWSNTGFSVIANNGGASQSYWNFRRAPSFFDEVCYTGTGSNTTQTHNLQAVPELMIVKSRSGTARDWAVYIAPMGNNYFACLNDGTFQGSSSTMWNDTTPTASVFTVGTNVRTNNSGQTYVAYLFATCAGVSKVGSYTGTGTTKQVDCGFTGGARFVMIKRTDSTGSWYVWDSARGIVAGNDPYLLLNSTSAQVTNTDYVDTYSAGFEISSTAPAEINASGGTYIFLAIA